VTEQSIEAARQGLEQKIAQLNEAIDDVRQQISQVHTQNEQTPQKFTS
jgi:prefoldin subunit 5